MEKGQEFNFPQEKAKDLNRLVDQWNLIESLFHFEQSE